MKKIIISLITMSTIMFANNYYYQDFKNDDRNVSFIPINTYMNEKIKELDILTYRQNEVTKSLSKREASLFNYSCNGLQYSGLIENLVIEQLQILKENIRTLSDPLLSTTRLDAIVFSIAFPMCVSKVLENESEEVKTKLKNILSDAIANNNTKAEISTTANMNSGFGVNISGKGISWTVLAEFMEELGDSEIPSKIFNCITDMEKQVHQYLYNLFSFKYKLQLGIFSNINSQCTINLKKENEDILSWKEILGDLNPTDSNSFFNKYLSELDNYVNKPKLHCYLRKNIKYCQNEKSIVDTVKMTEPTKIETIVESEKILKQIIENYNGGYNQNVLKNISKTFEKNLKEVNIPRFLEKTLYTLSLNKNYDFMTNMYLIYINELLRFDIEGDKIYTEIYNVKLNNEIKAIISNKFENKYTTLDTKINFVSNGKESLVHETTAKFMMEPIVIESNTKDVKKYKYISRITLNNSDLYHKIIVGNLIQKGNLSIHPDFVSKNYAEINQKKDNKINELINQKNLIPNLIFLNGEINGDKNIDKLIDLFKIMELNQYKKIYNQRQLFLKQIIEKFTVEYMKMSTTHYIGMDKLGLYMYILDLSLKELLIKEYFNIFLNSKALDSYNTNVNDYYRLDNNYKIEIDSIIAIPTDDKGLSYNSNQIIEKLITNISLNENPTFQPNKLFYTNQLKQVLKNSLSYINSSDYLVDEIELSLKNN